MILTVWKKVTFSYGRLLYINKYLTDEKIIKVKVTLKSTPCLKTLY